MGLRNKLLLSFILTTFLPILVIATGSFQRFKNALQVDRIEVLRTIADVAVARIETFFKERKNNIQTIQQDDHIIEDFQALLQFKNNPDSIEYRSAKLSLDTHLGVVETVYGYIDVMLVNTEGRIVYVSNPEHMEVDLEYPLPDPGNKSFENGRRGIFLSDPFMDDRENDIPAMLLTVPLHETSGEWIGLIVFEMNMAPIYDFIQDRSGLGQSGETFIAKKEGDSARFLNPLRHNKTAILQMKVKFGSDTALPIQKAVQGRSGQGLSLDYRSKEVIAAWRYIPSLNWGLVAKIDSEEAFQEIEKEKMFITLVALLSLILGGGIAIVISKSITQPINKIQEGMVKVKQGQLEHRIASDVRGEVTPLVHLFNDMIAEIKVRNKDLNTFKHAINAAAIVAITDQKGVILVANDKFCEISKYRREELIGQDHRIVNSGSHSKAYIKEMWHTIANKKVWRGNLKNKAKDGSIYWVDTTIVPVLNEGGKPYQYLAIRFDITRRKKIEEEVFHLAHYDDLTGLPNRLLFKDRLDKIIKIRGMDKRPFALMFLDLDEFKLINDTLGHLAGDQVLQEVAKRLKECLREEDIVSRLSGDEFTIFLPAIGEKEDVFLVARKLIQALKIPIDIAGEELFVTCSIGITLFPDHGISPETLMKNADTAMYRAKENGRGMFSFYSPVEDFSPTTRLSMTSALYHAVEREELELHYQPIVDLKNGKITGMEALIRWRRADGDLVSPADFIPLAEKTGLILPIGEWVLETAMAQARSWREAGFSGLVMSVNVAAPQFQEGHFVGSVIEMMRNHGIEPGELKLELTESILMKNQEMVVSKLKQLEASGVKFSIDDFGTGFSSLSYLKRFPIHTLKIDQSFVRDLPEDREDAAITRMIIALAEQLQIDVIAEGIETKEQLSYLQARHCAFGQGYLFSRPVPKEAFTALLHSTGEDKRIQHELFDHA